jgi:hypothetical protein
MSDVAIPGVQVNMVINHSVHIERKHRGHGVRNLRALSFFLFGCFWLDLFINVTVMETSTAREKLMTYLADADENKINALYTLLEKDIEEEHTYQLTDEQYLILKEERAMYLRGEGKSYTQEEAIQIIKGERSFNV